MQLLGDEYTGAEKKKKKRKLKPPGDFPHFLWTPGHPYPAPRTITRGLLPVHVDVHLQAEAILRPGWEILELKKKLGLPWWRSGWESACQCRGHGFEPWSGKIPHAAEQLSPCATTAEPARLEPVLRNKRGRDNERPAHRDEEWPPLATTRESSRTATKTQHSHK